MNANKRAFLQTPRGTVAVVGAGASGIAGLRLLRRLGLDDVYALDDGAPDDVRARLSAADLDPNLYRGKVTWPNLDGADAVVLSPGVPRALAALQEAERRELPILNEIEIAASRLTRTKFYAVTGSNGKSTTVSLFGHLLRQAFDDVFVGGNLGTPLAAAVADGEEPRVCALELSSYQLETIDALEVSGAAVTNLAPDHLDRYPSESAYYAAKARVFGLLRDDGVASLNAGDVNSQRHLADQAAGARFDFNVPAGSDGVSLDDAWAVVRERTQTMRVHIDAPTLRGAHNKENAAAALALAAVAEVPAAQWQPGVSTFPGLPHRLEQVATVDGVLYVNDSKATNVDAAIKAVQSFDQRVHLLVGGVGKGASYARLVEASRGRVVGVYAFGEDAPALVAAFDGEIAVRRVTDLEAALAAAAAGARAGEVILLAPACASFDQFRNYQHRGEVFGAWARARGAAT